MQNMPVFPIVVFFEEDSSKVEFADSDEAGVTLEWFDSEDPEERSIVTDAQGRRVVLKVEKLIVQVCALADPI